MALPSERLPESFPSARWGSAEWSQTLCVSWLWALKDAPAVAVTMGWHSAALEDLKYFTGEKYTMDFFMKEL